MNLLDDCVWVSSPSWLSRGRQDAETHGPLEESTPPTKKPVGITCLSVSIFSANLPVKNYTVVQVKGSDSKGICKRSNTIGLKSHPESTRGGSRPRDEIRRC